MTSFFRFRFLKKITDILYPWGVSGAIILVMSVYSLILLNPIEDYQQGYTVMIMFLHVPASWLALGLYFAATLNAFIGLIWKLPLCFHYSRACLFYGCWYALLSLVSGAIWGKPMWGTFWVFDARLTSMLFLCFAYIGLLSVAIQAVNDQKRQTGFFILTILGFINIPIIKFSVEWWSTLHQPASILRASGPSMDAKFLWYLFGSTTALVLLSFCLVVLRSLTYVCMATKQQMRLRQERLDQFSHNAERA